MINEHQRKILIKAGKRSSVIGGVDWVDLTNFSYKFVKKTIPEMISDGLLDDLIQKGCKELKKKPKEYSEKDKMAFSLWLNDEIQSIAILEKENLTIIPDKKAILAGANNFEMFGELNTVISISRGFNIPMKKVWKLKYYEVFELRLYLKEEMRYNRQINSKMAEK